MKNSSASGVELTEKERTVVLAILKKYPKTVLFGSRIKGTSKKFSDLDVVIKDDLKDYEYVLLREEFEKSDLPFKVDLVNYRRADDNFKKIIDAEAIPLSAIVE
jgi:uncharacterized protein